MKTVVRSLLVLAVLVCLGCETTQGGGAPASSGGGASTSSSSNKMLTDADYKRIGVQETYENR